MNFKKIFLFSVLGIWLISGIVQAVSTSTSGSGTGVCNRLSGFISQMDQRVTDREARIFSLKNERKEKWSDRLGAWDARRNERRLQADAKLNGLIAKIEVRAKTEVQKKAVNDFKLAVEAAIKIRRQAFDDAVNTFRLGVNQVWDGRRQAIDSAVTNYKIAQKLAFDKAKADCASGGEPLQILATLKIQLKEAREKFATDRQAIDRVADQIRSLNETKKASMERAQIIFRAALETAKTNLKVVLPI